MSVSRYNEEIFDARKLQIDLPKHYTSIVLPDNRVVISEANNHSGYFKIGSFTQDTSGFTELAYHKTKKHLITTDRDKISVWNLDEEKPMQMSKYTHPNGMIKRLIAFSDEKHFFVADEKNCGIYEMKEVGVLNLVSDIPEPFFMEAVLSSDESTLICGRLDNSVGIWNIKERAKPFCFSNIEAQALPANEAKLANEKRTMKLCALTELSDPGYIACSYASTAHSDVIVWNIKESKPKQVVSIHAVDEELCSGWPTFLLKTDNNRLVVATAGRWCRQRLAIYDIANYSLPKRLNQAPDWVYRNDIDTGRQVSGQVCLMNVDSNGHLVLISAVDGGLTDEIKKLTVARAKMEVLLMAPKASQLINFGLFNNTARLLSGLAAATTIGVAAYFVCKQR
jgi:WD40 repeat protein